jgi:RecJ-like exonuclease
LTNETAAASVRTSIPEGLWASAVAASEVIKRASSVVVATHIDADGVAAASIASRALAREGIRAQVLFFKKLDEQTIASLGNMDAGIIWYTDLGSGSLSKLEGTNAVITDHHVPDGPGRTGARHGQAALTDFSTIQHVNPHLHGISGATDLSGAGSTFLVALAMSRENMILAPLAILGAVGDLQDQRARRLEGVNRRILAAAQAEHLVEAVQDIRYFGRETRPVHKMLEYSSDPFIPGITNNEEAALGLLLGLGMELKRGEAWKTWSDLDDDERSAIVAEIRDILVKSRRRPETIVRLTGEVYVFGNEARGSPVRDAKEFATLLNACGRHGRAEVGLRICSGDRGDALSEGLALLRDHRSALSQALNFAKDTGVTRLTNIQFFDAGDEIEETIVGTVAGMLLNSNGSDRSAPMVAFADSTEYSGAPKKKASARGTQDLVSMGMDLSYAMRAAAEKVGGVGGGHNIAAGATIPCEKKEEFLGVLDDIVGSQLTMRARRGE